MHIQRCFFYFKPHVNNYTSPINDYIKSWASLEEERLYLDTLDGKMPWAYRQYRSLAIVWANWNQRLGVIDWCPEEHLLSSCFGVLMTWDTVRRWRGAHMCFQPEGHRQVSSLCIVLNYRGLVWIVSYMLTFLVVTDSILQHGNFYPKV